MYSVNFEGGKDILAICSLRALEHDLVPSVRLACEVKQVNFKGHQLVALEQHHTMGEE